MKIIDVIITHSYSCNVCHKTFRVKEELDLNFLVICSKKCEFKFIYNLLQKQGYSIEDCKKVLKIIRKNKEIECKSYNLAIYEITKYYHKIGLSSITSLGSRLIAKAQGSRNSSKAQGSSISPPIYRGNEPEPEPCICNNGKLNFEPRFVVNKNKQYQKGGEL